MPTLRKPAVVPKRRKATALEAALLAPNCSRRTVERPRYIFLVGPSLLHKADHGIRFGHVVAHGVLGKNDARDHDHTVPILGTHKATIIDDQCLPGKRHPGEKIALSIARGHVGDYIAERKKQTGLGPQPARVQIADFR